MDPQMIIDLFREAVMVIIICVCTIVLPGLFLGLVVSIFQAATQINEQTLSFIPRLIITFITIMVAGSWLLRTVVEFTYHVFESIPQLVG